MVLLASKHNVDPYRLVDAFVEAWKKQTSHCGRLTISCRGGTQESAIFLVEKGENVVGQFPVNLANLRDPSLLIKHIQHIPIPRRKQQKIYQKKQSIAGLRYGMKGIDVRATIVHIPPAKRVVTRWGLEAYVSNVVIADDTGSIRLSLWNKSIRMVHVGDEVELKNCSVSRFGDDLQLRLGRKSTMSVRTPLQPDELIQYSTSR